jgi:hypothetical protein
MRESANQYAVRASLPNNALYIAVGRREVGEKRIEQATASVQADGGEYRSFDRHRDFESAYERRHRRDGQPLHDRFMRDIRDGVDECA